MWDIETPMGDYQNKETDMQFNNMHESYPKIGQGLTSKHGSPETETADAHRYISTDTSMSCSGGSMR